MLYHCLDLEAWLHLMMIGRHRLHFAILADLVAHDRFWLALAALYHSWLLYADTITCENFEKEAALEY